MSEDASESKLDPSREARLRAHRERIWADMLGKAEYHERTWVDVAAGGETDAELDRHLWSRLASQIQTDAERVAFVPPATRGLFRLTRS